MSTWAQIQPSSRLVFTQVRLLSHQACKSSAFCQRGTDAEVQDGKKDEVKQLISTVLSPHGVSQTMPPTAWNIPRKRDVISYQTILPGVQLQGVISSGMWASSPPT